MPDIEFIKLHPGQTIPPAIEESYLASFPEEERRPIEQIRQRIEMNDPFFNFYLLRAEDTTVGFVTIWRLPGAIYIEHFAILASLRGKAYGSRTIRELLDESIRKRLNLDPTAPLVLEVELPESSPEAVKRIEFYNRCGLTAMEDFPYYQPPYRDGGPQVPMMLMSSAPLPDATSFVIMLHTLVYNQ